MWGVWLSQHTIYHGMHTNELMIVLLSFLSKCTESGCSVTYISPTAICSLGNVASALCVFIPLSLVPVCVCACKLVLEAILYHSVERNYIHDAPIISSLCTCVKITHFFLYEILCEYFLRLSTLFLATALQSFLTCIDVLHYRH